MHDNLEKLSVGTCIYKFDASQNSYIPMNNDEQFCKYFCDGTNALPCPFEQYQPLTKGKVMLIKGMTIAQQFWYNNVSLKSLPYSDNDDNDDKDDDNEKSKRKSI